MQFKASKATVEQEKTRKILTEINISLAEPKEDECIREDV
jgi:hypothetical protein